MKKLDKKIYRKYIANHWWLRDYKNHIIKINQNYINKIFKKFNIKGKIIQYPNIIQESDNIFIPKRGIIESDLTYITNKSKFYKYVKFLETYNYDILRKDLEKDFK